MRLRGKVALVTGGASGIGRAICLRFAQEGAHVFVVDIDDAGAANTAQAIAGLGGTARDWAADVASESEVEGAVGAALSAFSRIDVLCNVAGVGSTETAVDTSLETFERVLAVCARGTFLCSKHVLPAMIRQGGGSVINMSSVAALVGLPDRAAYCAAKGAVSALTRAMAVDHVSQGIRVNAICPGTVDTPWVAALVSRAEDPDAVRQNMTARQPMGRLGTADEIAAAAVYLASDEAAFVTGTELVIDGGLTAR